MTSLKLLDTSGAVAQLQNGNIIAYPTEAVFGLGCDPYNESAIDSLLKLKGRNPDAGFVLIASDLEQLQPWIAEIDPDKLNQAMQTWPGPVTWLFPRATGVSDLVAGNHDTIAVRITAHQASHALCSAFGSALISTSANPGSQPPARSTEQVAGYFGSDLSGILAGQLGGATHPSEIRDLESGKIIRSGV